MCNIDATFSAFDHLTKFSFDLCFCAIMLLTEDDGGVSSVQSKDATKSIRRNLSVRNVCDKLHKYFVQEGMCARNDF